MVSTKQLRTSTLNRLCLCSAARNSYCLRLSSATASLFFCCHHTSSTILSARAYQREHSTYASACTSARPHHKCQCLHGKQQRHHSARTAAPAEKHTANHSSTSHRALPVSTTSPSLTNLSFVFMLLPWPCVTHYSIIAIRTTHPSYSC